MLYNSPPSLFFFLILLFIPIIFLFCFINLSIYFLYFPQFLSYPLFLSVDTFFLAHNFFSCHFLPCPLFWSIDTSFPIHNFCLLTLPSLLIIFFMLMLPFLPIILVQWHFISITFVYWYLFSFPLIMPKNCLKLYLLPISSATLPSRLMFLLNQLWLNKTRTTQYQISDSLISLHNFFFCLQAYFIQVLS